MTSRNHLIFSCATKFRACVRCNRYHITVNPQSYVNKLTPLILNVRNPFASCTTCEDTNARRNLPKHVHTRGFRRTQIQTQRKKGINLTGNFESKSWPALTRTSPTALPTGVKPYQSSKRRKGKGNEKTSRKESEKKSSIIFRFLVGELSSMIRITIARKYLNRIESEPPWFQSLKFNFPVISRHSLLSVHSVDSQGWKRISLIHIYRWWPRTLKFNTWHYFKSTSYGEKNCIQDIIQLTF